MPVMECEQTTTIEMDLEVEETTHACTECEKETLVENMTSFSWDGTDYEVCPDCRSNFYICECCDRIFPSDEERGGNCGTLCADCYDEYYFTCEQCGHVFHSDDGYDGYCNTCHEACQKSTCDYIREFELPCLDGRVLSAEQVYPLSLTANALSTHGIHIVKDWLYSHFTGKLPYQIYSNLCSQSIVDMIEWVKEHPRGSLVKRIAQWYKQHKDYKLTPEERNTLGDMIAKRLITDSDVRVLLTRNLNQEPEVFYHERSCWWGDEAESRCYMKAHGGFGMLLLDEDDEHTVGRCWVLALTQDGKPTEDLSAQCFVLFNGYGANGQGLYEFGHIFSQLTGLPEMKQVRLFGRPMYVNCDQGLLLYADTSCRLGGDAGDRPELHLPYNYSCDCR